MQGCRNILIFLKLMHQLRISKDTHLKHMHSLFHTWKQIQTYYLFYSLHDAIPSQKENRTAHLFEKYRNWHTVYSPLLPWLIISEIEMGVNITLFWNDWFGKWCISVNVHNLLFIMFINFNVCFDRIYSFLDWLQQNSDNPPLQLGVCIKTI